VVFVLIFETNGEINKIFVKINAAGMFAGRKGGLYVIVFSARIITQSGGKAKTAPAHWRHGFTCAHLK
jgi:hypothetical protein